ncbi:MAG: polyamine ABC transporter ATP-binding protein [SAR324 cluster bacterium]|nr:polyamine ABC transporter ATP-binding protein [SAR324 cluster bacterium]
MPTLSEDPQSFVEIKQINKTFDRIVAVKDVNLNIRKGEIFALLGSSGCGKSTLLRMLAGFETPSSGQILIDGEDMANIPPYLRHVNMMFQSYALFPHMTVEKNVAFGLKQEGTPKNIIKKKVAEALSLVEMQNYGKRSPHQLSGGQRQRVALARILVKSPKLLLLDEPMAALDKKLRVQMQLELVDIIERVGVTCVMVTHDQEEAMTMAWRIAVMNEGSIIQVGTPAEIYEFPHNRFCAEFIGSVNIFSGKIAEEKPDQVVIASHEIENKLLISHGLIGNVGTEVAVAIRPEKIVVSRELPQEDCNWAKGVVKDIVYLGGLSTYHVTLTSGKTVMATQVNINRSTQERFTWDDEAYISWSPQSGVVLSS